MRSKSSARLLFYIQIAFTILIILGCSLFYAVQMRNSGETKALNTLSEVSGQNVIILNKEIEKEEKVLLNLANLFATEGNADPQLLVKHLTVVNQQNAFKRMGIILPDGTAYTTDHLTLDLSGRHYFQKAMTGICAISDTRPDAAGGQPITVYAAPLINQGTVGSILFATYSTKYYEHLLSTSTFGGAGYSYVVKSDGTCMVESTVPDPLRTYEDLYQRLNQDSPDNNEVATELAAAMKQGKKGSIVFTGPVRKYMYYQPLGINDWYLLTIVPVSVVQRDVNGSLIMSYVFSFICALLIVILLLHMMISRERTRKELESIAFVDKITGGSTYDRFKKDFSAAYQQAGGSCALVAMNLERFRLINDMYGYEEGDNVLRLVWSELHEALEPGELLSRQNADHFLLLLKYQDLEQLTHRLNSMYEKINNTRFFDGRYYELRPCFGIYEIETPDLVDSMTDLAQLAVQNIKYNVFSHIAVYDSDLRQNLIQQKNLENHFEDALKSREFILFFQAKYDLKKDCYEGAEVLVRWDSSHAGFLSPNTFIPLFERDGFIIRLDTYLFCELCHQLRQWIDQGIHTGPISINLSRMQLYRPDFIDEYLFILEQYQIPTSLIQLEITETALFNNSNKMLEILNRLRSHGIRILMDDFGSGYSSILMLKNLPIDILKIDKGLIDGLESNEKARMIVKNVIELSHQLGLSVVAEGVEVKEQADLLKEYGCDEIQGYYYARPAAPADYLSLIEQHRRI